MWSARSGPRPSTTTARSAVFNLLKLIRNWLHNLENMLLNLILRVGSKLLNGKCRQTQLWETSTWTQKMVIFWWLCTKFRRLLRELIWLTFGPWNQFTGLVKMSSLAEYWASVIRARTIFWLAVSTMVLFWSFMKLIKISNSWLPWQLSNLSRQIITRPWLSSESATCCFKVASRKLRSLIYHLRK